VFFDDILIYSQDLNTHLSHLHMILLTMRRNSLYAERIKMLLWCRKGLVFRPFHLKRGDSYWSSKNTGYPELALTHILEVVEGFFGTCRLPRSF